MKKKILVIDDSEIDLKIIETVLKAAGYAEIILASSGEEGIAGTQSSPPDLAVIDTNLPGLDGFETCKKLKSIQTGVIYIIMITGNIETVNAWKARKSGADDGIFCFAANPLTCKARVMKKNSKK